MTDVRELDVPVRPTQCGPHQRDDHGKSRDEYDDVPELCRALSASRRGSPAADALRERLITRCTPLADHIAARYRDRGQNYEDVRQCAYLGLVLAVERLDPAQSDAFVGYAITTISGEIRRYFRDKTWAIYVPRAVKEVVPSVRRAIEELSNLHGVAPTPLQIANHLGLDRETVVAALSAREAYVLRPLDATRGQEGDGDVRTVADSIGEVESGYDGVEDRDAVERALAVLEPLERRVVELRFYRGMAQTQVAAEIGRSQMTVSRMLAGSLRLMRHSLE